MIIELDGVKPNIDPSAFIAPTAVIIGDVHIGPKVSIWYGAVLRGDMGSIVIGEGTNIQDNSVVHGPVEVGNNCHITHCVVLHSCKVGDGAFIGMNCTILDGAELGPGSMIAAGAVVKENDRIPPNVLVAGTPAVVKKEVSGQAKWWVENGPIYYAEARDRYLKNNLGELQVPKEKPEG